MNKRMLRCLALFSGISICSFQVIAQVSKSTINDFLNDSAVKTGHAGISIFEPATGKYLYNYNAEKNFLPSSNTKLFTLYAGMKYLGDSLVGIRYNKLPDSSIEVYASGDPTFLHPDFKSQPVFDFLVHQNEIIFNQNLKINSYGQGWSWDDYEELFMCHRSEFPMYGNTIELKWIRKDSIQVVPEYFRKNMITWLEPDSGLYVKKLLGKEDLYISNGHKKNISIPFDNDLPTAIDLLADTLKNKKIFHFNEAIAASNGLPHGIIHSRPVDSLFRPMMFNSDNFFAEQTLLMVSNEKLGYMSDEAMIDTLLKTDLKGLPTGPRWVDGSGLSRYNLFSPKDFVYILVKLKNEFGQERMNRILPAGGQGTLKGYYGGGGDYIHAKTGSMSNNVSLSGYLITAKKRLLVFSVIINNFSGSGTSGRRAIERLIEQVRLSN